MSAAAQKLEVAGKPFAFLPRGRVVGSLQWLCPRCGTLVRSRMDLCDWKVRCTRASCHLTLVVGVRFGVPVRKPGPHWMVPPKDHTFPECELVEWHSGEPACSLVPYEPSTVPEDEAGC
jgi:hypothetical protein